MKKLSIKSVVCALACTGALLTSSVAVAEGFPEKPITILYPWASGDPTETVLRHATEIVARELGQPIVINNVTGAGGVKALAAGAAADPDGYTLASNWVAAHISSKLFDPKLPFGNDSFEPIAGIFAVPFTITVSNSHPANDIAGLVDWAAKEGRSVNVGVCAAQSVPRLVGEQFFKSAKINYNPVPSSGGCMGDNVTGLMNGSLDVSVSIVPATKQFEGQVKHLGLLADEPHALAPHIKTVNEQGVSLGWGDVALGWGGLVAPSGTPDDVVAKLQGAFSKAVQSKEFLDKVGGLKGLVKYSSPEDFEALWASSRKALEPAINAIKAKQ